MCDSCAIFVVGKPGIYRLPKGLADIHSKNCTGILWSEWPQPKPQEQCGFQYIHGDGGPGCQLGKYLPKSMNQHAVACKLNDFLNQHPASKRAITDAEGEVMREHQPPIFKQKPAMWNKWCLNDKNYRGSHFPLLMWTHNVGRRTPEALRRRSNGAKGFKGDKGGKGGKGVQGGKGGKGTKGFQGGPGDKGYKGNKGLPRWPQQAPAFTACSVPPALSSIPPAHYTADGTSYINHHQFHGMQMPVPAPITGAHQAFAQSSNSSGGAHAWQSHRDGGPSFGSWWDSGNGITGGWNNYVDGQYCWSAQHQLY